MSSERLRTMSAEQLVREFHSIAVRQGRALLGEDNQAYNTMYDQMEGVEAELRSREGDQRHALLPLLNDPNTHVRLKTAISCLKIAPAAARQTLQAIVDADDFSEAVVYARGMLSALDEGRYVPQ